MCFIKYLFGLIDVVKDMYLFWEYDVVSSIVNVVEG